MGDTGYDRTIWVDRMNRPSFDEYFTNMVKTVSTRGSCARRKTGCILVDDNNQVLATGYNGPPSGFTNCTDKPCAGAEAPSGEALDKCEAIHAEQNALLQCPDVRKIRTAYCTTAPCIHCVKLLLNTNCSRIVFIDDYPHSHLSKEMWERKGTWEKFNE